MNRRTAIERRRCSYRLPVDTANTLADLAKSEGRSQTSIMCRAIALYSAQNQKPLKPRRAR